MDPRDVANRDLLIGLLALQNGLVDQDVLVAVFRTWTRDRSRSIAEILSTQGAIDAAERALLEALAENHLKRHGGDAERSLASLNAGMSTRESLAKISDSEIMATLAHVGTGLLEKDAETTAPYPDGHPPTDRQRFRILRPHARGGLGAVFVAVDEELHREVALKQILDHHADDALSRARFVLEAEITGGLEHPGIVPVYGLGRDGDGRPYYAMRFIRGGSLKEAIFAFHADAASNSDAGRRSLALRELLHRFNDVCNAIEYAHGRGVLHRDIKPANVIVGKHGETLVVDWGLAKAMGHSDTGSRNDERTLIPSASGSAETLPGSAIGTPAYMSPEQAAGDLDQLGPRSDVYSLGATLYCLLTGKAPFEGSDLAEILGLVRKGAYTRPRQIDPSIDHALEAVCLKAMATKPEERYTSARALADDLERWAAGEPVSAWREPIARRARRWAKRHRPAVTAAIVLLATAIIANVIYGFLIAREQRQTERQRGLAEARAELLERQLYINRVNLAYRECLANNIGLAERLLDGCPPAHRGWEWDYTRRLCHFETMTIRIDAGQPAAPGRAFSNAAISPDGNRIAAVDGSSAVTIREMASGRVLRSLVGQGPLFSVEFSGNGSRVAAGGAGSVTVWEIDSGVELQAFKKHNDIVTGLSFSPDGKRLATCTSTPISARHKPEVKIWDIEGGEEAGSYVEQQHWGALNLAFAPDGKRLAVVQDWLATVTLLDGKTARPLKSLGPLPGKGVFGVASHPNGRQIALACRDGTLSLLDAETGSVIRSFRGHNGVTTDVTFSPDGQRLASSSNDGTVRLWQTETGGELAIFRGHDGGVRSVRFSPDGVRLVSCGDDRTIKVWETSTAGDPMTLEGNRGWAFRTRFAPDGRLVTGGFAVVSLRDPATGGTIRDITTPGGGVQGLAVSPDGQRVAAAREFRNAFDLFGLADGQLLTTFSGHAGRVRGVAFAPDGRHIASASDDKTIRLWDVATGREIRVLRGHDSGVFAVDFSPDGRRLASIGRDGTVRIWDPETAVAIRVLRGAAQVTSNELSKGVAFSPDGRRIASTGAGGQIVVWDAETGATILTVGGYNGGVNSVTFDPTGRRVASAFEDGTIKLWDTVTGDEIFTLRGHVAGVLGVAFSPDGMRIASASQDMTVKVWDAAFPSPDVLRTRCDEAITKIRTEQAYRLNQASWQIVASADRSADSYARALRDAEAASRLAPENGLILNTLGVALYRVGKLTEARQTLNRSLALNTADDGEPNPTDVAFLAMTCHRAGDRIKANAELAKVRAMMKRPRWENDGESRGFLRPRR